MPRVLVNNIGFAYVTESSLGVPGITGWRQLEPNTINNFGANVSTVSRSPISKSRQRRKGTITDLTSGVGFESDITISSFRNFIEGFLFSNAVNRNVSEIASSAASTTNDSYTVSGLTASQASKMEVGTLLWVSGFTNSRNNGLKSVDADIASAATSISVDQNLSTQSGESGILSMAGYRIPGASAGTWDYTASSKQASLGLTGVGTILGNLGLTPGQLVHVGSVAELGADVINGFQNNAANDIVGYARVLSITNNSVVFNKLDPALRFDDTTSPTTAVDILFGEFVRNVKTDATDYLERSFQFEMEFDNLGSGGATAYQYSLGNYCNTIGFNIPLTDKATISFDFIGTDTESPSATRKTGASTASTPTRTIPFNTSSDIARLRITEVDEDGLTTDFKSLTLNLSNNVTPENVVAHVGARYINTANFEVDIEAQLIFTNPDIINKIRDNETVTMDFIMKNGDGIIGVDIPSLTLGGGDREFPVGESVLINTTSEAFEDSNLGTSIGVSIIPVPLP